MCGLPERNFLVTLASRDDMALREQFVITSPCVCDIDQWVADNASRFSLTNPFVIDVDDKAAYHLPLSPGVHASAS